MNTPKAPTVACPTCGQPAEYSPCNRFRPFCSERCKLIDLGEWAREGYRIPMDEMPSDDGMRNE
ncbi:MAG: DNA gyrase inhibitor YacG [Sulfuricella sp.]|nr:DNA gyrase inhibitor YacG [Sulfuricella sp.]